MRDSKILAGFVLLCLSLFGSANAGYLALLGAGMGVGGFSPNQISGIQIWLDASDGSTITLSGSAITQWNDKSGNGNNATQVIPGQEPTIEIAAQNGLNTANFDSGNTTTLNFDSQVSITGDYTVVAIVRRKAAGAIEIFGGSTVAWAFAPEWYSDDRIYGYDQTKIFSSSSTYTDQAGYHFLSSVVDNSLHAINTYYDSTTPIAYTTGNQANNVYSNMNKIGRADGEYSNSYIAEVILYNRQLNSTEIGLLYTYLQAKWATP